MNRLEAATWAVLFIAIGLGLVLNATTISQPWAIILGGLSLLVSTPYLFIAIVRKP